MVPGRKAISTDGRAEAEFTATGAVFSGAGAQLEVTGTYAPSVSSIADLRNLIENSAGNESITYSPQGTTWMWCRDTAVNSCIMRSSSLLTVSCRRSRSSIRSASGQFSIRCLRRSRTVFAGACPSSRPANRARGCSREHHLVSDKELLGRSDRLPRLGNHPLCR